MFMVLHRYGVLYLFIDDVFYANRLCPPSFVLPPFEMVGNATTCQRFGLLSLTI